MDGLLTLFASVAITALIGIPWIIAIITPIGAVFGALVVAFKYNLTPSLRNVEKNTYPMRLSILVADDDEISVVPLVTALANRSVDVKYVESGLDVISELKKNHYDLLFLDMLMPGKNGAEVIQEIESLDDHDKKLSVVLYTSHEEVCRNLMCIKLEKIEIKALWEKKLPVSAIIGNIDRLFREIEFA